APLSELITALFAGLNPVRILFIRQRSLKKKLMRAAFGWRSRSRQACCREDEFNHCSTKPTRLPQFSWPVVKRQCDAVRPRNRDSKIEIRKSVSDLINASFHVEVRFRNFIVFAFKNLF